MPYQPPRKEKKSSSDGLQALVQAEKLMQIAIMLPAAVFLGWLFGSWLDRHFQQTWISIVGILLGGAAGLSYVVRLVLHAGQDGRS
jgi:ATP synthase protein I